MRRYSLIFFMIITPPLRALTMIQILRLIKITLSAMKIRQTTTHPKSLNNSYSIYLSKHRTIAPMIFLWRWEAMNNSRMLKPTLRLQTDWYNISMRMRERFITYNWYTQLQVGSLNHLIITILEIVKSIGQLSTTTSCLLLTINIHTGQACTVLDQMIKSYSVMHNICYIAQANCSL